MNNIGILRAEIEKIDEKIFALIHKKGEIMVLVQKLRARKIGCQLPLNG